MTTPTLISDVIQIADCFTLSIDEITIHQLQPTEEALREWVMGTRTTTAAKPDTDGVRGSGTTKHHHHNHVSGGGTVVGKEEGDDKATEGEGEPGSPKSPRSRRA